MSDKCKYPGCEHHRLGDLEYCLFHAPRDGKGIELGLFNASVLNLLDKNHYNFEGYIFPGRISFLGKHFEKDALFRKAVFCGKAEFRDSWFERGADFSEVTFEGGADWTDVEFQRGVSFRATEFFGEEVSFRSTKFLGSRVEFDSSKFIKTRVDFREAVFSSENVDFSQATFEESNVDFSRSQFRGSEVSFERTEFSDTTVDFSGSSFLSDVKFRDNLITKELKFIDTRLDEKSGFYFTNPIFRATVPQPPRILFKRVRFNPFLTFFGGIHPGTEYADRKTTERPIILFRLCHLKDVSFANNDMSLFSFYNSWFFEEAHLESGRWISTKDKILSVLPIKVKRHNQIVEEQLFEVGKAQASNAAATKNLKKYYEIELLGTYGKVADVYLKFKAAADRAKNYHLAAWFYFNEFEMKRRHLQDKLRNTRWLHGKFAVMGRLLLYNFYKVFAGYGEGPRWSVIWFGIFTVLFAIAHLFNGFQVPLGAGGAKTINYDLSKSLPNVVQFLGDFFYGVLFTLYRVIPVSYLPYQNVRFQPIDYGFWDLVLSLLNVIVLILMIVFIGIGLKRHFRRF